MGWGRPPGAGPAGTTLPKPCPPVKEERGKGGESPGSGAGNGAPPPPCAAPVFTFDSRGDVWYPFRHPPARWATFPTARIVEGPAGMDPFQYRWLVR